MIPTSGKLSLCLNAGKMGRIDLETETHIAEYQNGVPAKLRALTPLECERLQGFPDGYLRIPYDKGGVADPEMVRWVENHMRDRQGPSPACVNNLACAPLGRQYSAIGNSMSVPAVRWIGERIALIDAQ